MSRRPLKKLEEDSDDGVAPTLSAPAVDEDALMASLSGFLVPDAFSSVGASQQQTQPIASSMGDDDERQEHEDDDGFDPVNKPNLNQGSDQGAAAAAAAASEGKQAPAKRKRKRKADVLTAAEASAERAAEAQAAVANDVAAAAHRAAVAKARRLRHETPSTARIRHVASTGLVHSSLPLLSALVRERLMEHSLPAAARALAQLYPAFRLDVDTVCNSTIEILSKHAQQHPSHHTPAHGGPQATNNQLTRFYKKIINLHPKNVRDTRAETDLRAWDTSPHLCAVC